jgi:autotransporter-associated beta strand protein
MHKPLQPSTRTALSRAALLALLALGGTPAAMAADVTWSNASSSFAWNATHANWSIGAWNNAVGNEAIFGSTGVGNVSVDPAGVNVASMSFTGDGYTLSGGPINLVPGGGSLNTNFGTGATMKAIYQGLISTDPGVTATINSAINTSVGLVKTGGGTLVLSGPLSFSGAGLPLLMSTSGPLLNSDLVVDGISQKTQGGTLQIANASVLPSSTRVAIGNGMLDLGSNNVTLGALTFINQNDTTTYDPSINASYTGSVIGTGTLKVTGDIAVIGRCCGNNGANTIANNLDLGGGTQIVRVSQNSSPLGYRGLQFTGVLSNGSLLKTTGIMENGVPGTPDGIGLYGNNTYTGSTVINGGSSLVTGTNASSFVEVAGNGAILTLAGANGSYQAATTLKAVSGATLTIDNTASLSGQDTPSIAAGNNGDRIKDTAEIQLRSGGLNYVGASNTASSETFGKLNVTAGHNVVTMTPTGTGTVTLTDNGDLALGSTATLQITSANLGGTAKLFVNGALPTSDSTGILHGVIGKSDFVTYNATTGVTPLAAAAYAGSFTAGANVALAAGTNAINSSVSINALKTTGTVTNNIATGQVLNVASGMLLNTSGTTTYTGGTLDFGSTAGTFFGGTHTINSAVTGTNGLINATASLNLNGDLSGLAGAITTNSGTTTINTNTFAGSLQLRSGTLAFKTSQTLAGQGGVTLGSPENDNNLLNSNPVLDLTGMAAGSTFARNITVDNGGQTVAGMADWYSFLPSLNTLATSTGSQTLSGNLLLNSGLRLSNSTSASNSGVTNFTGNVSGAGVLWVAAGRFNFSGNLSNTGGININNAGGKAYVSFTGTANSAEPMMLYGGNSQTVNGVVISGTTVNYNPGSLPTGNITFINGYNNTAPVLIPNATSTLANNINATTADIYTQVNNGITSTWTGQVTTDGSGYLTKTGAGTLVLTNTGSNAAVRVNAGTLLMNGQLASAAGQGVTVNTGGTLGGTGNITSAALVNAGGTIMGGVNGAGALSVAGNVEVAGALAATADGALGAGLLNTGSLTLDSGSSLQLALSNLPSGTASETFLLVANLGANAIAGAFSSVTGVASGYTYSLNYAFNGVDSFGKVGDGNDLAVTITAVPEPSSYALLLSGSLLMLWLQRRRRIQD